MSPKLFRAIRTFYVIAICCCCFYYEGTAQKTAFYDDVQAFKRQDSIHAPARNAILFVGSSSFTRWVNLEDCFPGHTIVNRAFGGSSLPDLIRYVNDIIYPYRPKQVVIYCGENDFVVADTVSAMIVYTRFKQLFQLIRNGLPGVPIAYVSIKPSPSREKYWTRMVEANRLIKNFLNENQETVFIDVYHKMFNKDGTVMKDIFVEDNLHMNAKGYAIWQKAIEPYLLNK